MLTLKNAPAPSLFNAINKGGQSLPAQAAEFPQETSPLSLPLHQFVQRPPSASLLHHSCHGSGFCSYLSQRLGIIPQGCQNPAAKDQVRRSAASSSFPCCEICTNFSFMVPFLQFLFCKKASGKMSAPGPRTLTLRMMTGTSGGSTARRSSPTPTSQGS